MSKQPQPQEPQDLQNYRLVAKFVDSQSAKLVVTCQQGSSSEFTVGVRHTKAGEKKALVGMRSTFPSSQKSQATARFNELVALAEQQGWPRARQSSKVSFDYMPLAAK